MKTKTCSIILFSILAFGLSPAFARQPRMEKALEHLRAARAELQAAEMNKGGHRERAIEMVDRAIAQVEEGIRFAR